MDQQYGDNGQQGYGGGGAENYDYDQPQSQQRAPPSKFQVRPMVDPEAEGEVDPSQ